MPRRTIERVVLPNGWTVRARRDTEWDQYLVEMLPPGVRQVRTEDNDEDQTHFFDDRDELPATMNNQCFYAASRAGVSPETGLPVQIALAEVTATGPQAGEVRIHYTNGEYIEITLPVWQYALPSLREDLATGTRVIVNGHETTVGSTTFEQMVREAQFKPRENPRRAGAPRRRRSR